MAKAGKTIPSETEEGAKPKSKKPLLIIIAVLVLGGAGGAGWFFTKGDSPAEETKETAPVDPKFFVLEPFIVNLQQDGGEKFLQIGITFKFTELALEEKIRLHLPEIRSRIILLLSGKSAEDLMPAEGKRLLAHEIIAETSKVLSLPIPAIPKPAPVPAPNEVDASAAAVPAETTPDATAPVAAKDAQVATAAPQAKPAAKGEQGKETAGPLDVLFTSFIIQ